MMRLMEEIADWMCSWRGVVAVMLIAGIFSARDGVALLDETRSTARDTLIGECQARYTRQMEDLDEIKQNWADRENQRRQSEYDSCDADYRSLSEKHSACLDRQAAANRRNSDKQMRQMERRRAGQRVVPYVPEIVFCIAPMRFCKIPTYVDAGDYRGSRTDKPIKQQLDACLKRANQQSAAAPRRSRRVVRPSSPSASSRGAPEAKPKPPSKPNPWWLKEY